MATIENGCEAIGGGCFWAEFWKSYEPIAHFIGHDAFRNGALVIAAFVTLFVAIWRAKIADEDKKTSVKQADTSEAGLNIDRFQKGIEMIASQNRTLREAGIYLLSELAEQNMKTYYHATQTALVGFISELSVEHLGAFNRAHKQSLILVSDPIFELVSGENELALQKLSNLKTIAEIENIHSNRRICINSANFCVSSLEDGNLKKMILINVNFSSSHLMNANFTGTAFNKVNFTEADLSGAIFGDNQGLTYAQLSKAKNVDPEFLAKLKAEEDEATAKSTDKNSST